MALWSRWEELVPLPSLLRANNIKCSLYIIDLYVTGALNWFLSTLLICGTECWIFWWLLFTLQMVNIVSVSVLLLEWHSFDIKFSFDVLDICIIECSFLQKIRMLHASQTESFSANSNHHRAQLVHSSPSLRSSFFIIMFIITNVSCIIVITALYTIITK